MSDNTHSPQQQGQNDANSNRTPSHYSQFNSNSEYQTYLSNYTWQKQQNEGK